MAKYLEQKEDLQAGEIRQRTFDKYHATCGDLIAAFGRRRVVDDITAADFGGLRVQWVQRFGPLKLADQIQIVQSVFKFGYDAHKGLLFITKYGQAWIAANKDSVRGQFDKALVKLKLKKLGVSFYACRHTFRTIADEVGDRPAIDYIMGHQDGADMSTHYRERIRDERLRKVTHHVRTWLFGD